LISVDFRLLCLFRLLCTCHDHHRTKEQTYLMMLVVKSVISITSIAYERTKRGNEQWREEGRKEWSPCAPYGALSTRRIETKKGIRDKQKCGSIFYWMLVGTSGKSIRIR
jgi:hypothetical protein